MNPWKPNIRKTLRSYDICIICLIRGGIAQIRISSNLKINIDYLHCDKIELFCVTCIREKYGAAEFGFFLIQNGKIYFFAVWFIEWGDWTIHQLCKFNGCEICQVRRHDLTTSKNIVENWGFCVMLIGLYRPLEINNTDFE